MAMQTNAPATCDVSVIIPVWNSGRYFAQCLDSVLGQTLAGIEVIVVDNASTDGSGALADERAAADDRVRVVHLPENRGAGRARNVALSLACGEYVAFMDSDDLYPSAGVLERLLAVARREGADMCGGSLYKIDADSAIMDARIPGQFFEAEGWLDFAAYQYEGGFYRFLYRRAFLEEKNLLFPPFRRFQDSLFFVRAMLAAGRFYALPDFTYAYRKNHKRIPWTRDRIRDHLQGLRAMLRLSRDQGPGSTTPWRRTCSTPCSTGYPFSTRPFSCVLSSTSSTVSTGTSWPRKTASTRCR